MKDRGVLTVVSGFAGSGKGTIMKELLSRYDNYALSISATTRAPRPGEEHGKHYFFVGREEFEEMIRKDELLEYARYVENYYGTPRKYVEEMLGSGKDVILEIETQGALLVREKLPDTLLLFISPPSVQEIYNRLKKRGTETEENIRQRMTRAVTEAELAEQYDYLIINDDLEECIKQVHETIQAAHFRMDRSMEQLKKLQSEFAQYIKQ
ncbi:MAG: guanylate kinase [Lachnospiraceae bacterium]|nr:guanylate kinase [Lachnospiraceae bacterium]